MNDEVLFYNWIKDIKCVYIEQNLYVEPKFKIIKCEKIEKEDFPHCNSTGWWGHERHGVHRLWIDFTIFNINKHMGGFPKETRVENVIRDAFLLVKSDWVLRNRKEKLNKLKCYQQII